jgi:acetyl-CoA C-acetyltransferase
VSRPGIVSAYSTPYETRSKLEAWELLEKAVKGVVESVDKGIEPSEIDLVVVANFSDRFGGILHTGPLALRYIGNPDARALRVENACSAGGTGIFLAWSMIRAGLARNALIVGFEKMSRAPTSTAANEVLMAAGAPEEIMVGLPFFASYALMARAYMDRFGAREEDLALVAVKNHENALRNPLAQFKRRITVEDVMRSPYVAPPLKLYDCSPLSDGAAAVIVSGEPRRYTDTPVYIAGMGLAHDKPGVFEREDMTAMIAARKASEQAYRASGLGPRDMDLAEVHDAFTISEIILYEMLGFAERGGGARLVRERTTWFDGDIPVNPSGGLKAKGHPIGATGVGMAAELFWQLRGEAGERQVPGAEKALMENHGGTGATSVVAVMRR